MRIRRPLLSALLAALLPLGGLPIAGIAPAALASAPCQLGPGGAIRHVVVLQFDNVHFTRDDPNVPSDLEQMPHLLSFLEGNGTLLTNHHTPLIAHTATDLLTALTGVYGDRMGVPVSNSYRYWNPNGTTSTGVSFGYWTSPIFDPTTSTPTDTLPNMLTADGKNAPAPWVPFTRAGCTVGSIATANTVLENTAVDVPTVFGTGSPQAQEVTANPGQAFADFVGIAVHCAAGDPLCAAANGGVADTLPDEPGGYTGFNGLFGHRYVAPQIHPSGPLTDLAGNVIQDPTGHVGFPGFDGMSASVSLSYAAAMQEHGVPVTYAYLSDAHDKHQSGPAYGPGEAGYVAALKGYDDAFATFFSRLAGDGITTANTLFVVNADEGDHFVGGPPSPAGCDGVTVPCTYSTIGEVNVNLAGLLATQQGITTPFKVHSDSAPTIYLTGHPASTDAVTRAFERATSALTITNPITGATEPVAHFQADPVEMGFLHMVTADPMRTPTYTLFAQPDDFLFAGAPNCTSPCVQVQPGFAWNHGDVSPDINRTWLGLAGPGVQVLGATDATWTDHADIRPTLMALTGLVDDYRHDGRVITQVLRPNAVPAGVAGSQAALETLGALEKQLDSATGQAGMATLHMATVALASNGPGDGTYRSLEARIRGFTTDRDALVGRIEALLDAAEFHGVAPGVGDLIQLTTRSAVLLGRIQAAAAGV